MRRLLLAILGAAALAAAVAIGLGQSEEGSGAADTPQARRPGAAEVQRRLRGAPPELAALHAQANDLLGGGRKAFERRLRDLRGHPVVVNFWGSWCGPCRVELPVFQEQALRYGTRVAFLGVDIQDNAADARKLLRQVPVSYPSYEDPGARIFQSLGSFAPPTTIYYDRRGTQVFAHQGAYFDLAGLDRDIRRYALRDT